MFHVQRYLISKICVICEAGCQEKLDWYGACSVDISSLNPWNPGNEDVERNQQANESVTLTEPMCLNASHPHPAHAATALL